MILRYIVGAWVYLWRFAWFRWCCFHGPVGAINYGTAFILFTYYEIDKYTATNVGHLIHVFFGLFYDRAVTFQKVTEDRAQTWVKYWAVEGLSYISIILIIYILTDLYMVNLCSMKIAGYDQCGNEEYWVRGVPAMIVSTVISFCGHKYWTFAKANSQIRCT